jgi:hypothetical protein
VATESICVNDLACNAHGALQAWEQLIPAVPGKHSSAHTVCKLPRVLARRVTLELEQFSRMVHLTVLSVRCPHGSTLLHTAVANKHAKVAHWLLRLNRRAAGTNVVPLPDEQQNTALWLGITMQVRVLMPVGGP